MPKNAATVAGEGVGIPWLVGVSLEPLDKVVQCSHQEEYLVVVLLQDSDTILASDQVRMHIALEVAHSRVAGYAVDPFCVLC